MKKILTLSSDTFLWLNKHEGLIYDSKHHKSFEFLATASIYEMCKRLLDYNNLYSVEYDDNDCSVIDFVEKIVSIGAGLSHNEDKVVLSLPPLMKIQHSIDMREKQGYEFQDYALRHLTNIVVFTGGECPENDLYQQTLYPINSETILSYQEIISFLTKIDSPYIAEISIVFSTVSEYDNIGDLIDFLGTLNSSVTICVRSNDYSEFIQKMQGNMNHLKIKLLHVPGCQSMYPEKLGNNVLHSFLISSEMEYKAAKRESVRYSNNVVDFIPIFNGKNTDFFKANVLLTKKEILTSTLDRKGVFIHQVLNTNHFGTLYVMPDKNVYSDITAPALGSMSDSVYNLILEELSKNHSWRRVRNTGECKDCLYRYLCPSPGIYEKLMNIECICTDK